MGSESRSFPVLSDQEILSAAVAAADEPANRSAITSLKDLAERCRAAVAHDARLRERDAMSDKYAHHYRPVLKAEAEKAAKLLDEIDAIIGSKPGPYEPPIVYDPQQGKMVELGAASRSSIKE